jgi:hypothetical protein
MLIAGTPTWTFLSARDWAKRFGGVMKRAPNNIPKKSRPDLMDNASVETR